MIARTWHGFTTLANADGYEALLRTEIFPLIAGLRLDGYRGIQLLRRPLGDDVEFMTIMWFDSLAGIACFAGDDHEAAFVPAAARVLLARFDDRARHYDLVHAADGPVS